MISVQQLTKVYGTTLAVDHVSFEVEKGQIVGFLGPNAAGKSTTMRMLTCYLAPTSGTATINGFDIFHQSQQVRQSLGYLPESVPLYAEMRVDEYLEFRGKLRDLPADQRKKRIDYVVERCWLGTVRRKVIGHLSKGFRQRVGLADAMLHNPAVLILDEPTVGLDPNQIREMRRLIKALGGDHTVLLSTHILPEVEAICDHLVIIAGGRIVAKGALDELREKRKIEARVLVECQGPASDVKLALERVNGVAKVELLESDVKGVTLAAIKAKEGYDVRGEAARTVIQRGWPLREVKYEHATLEELFVQVTANQAMARVEEEKAA